MGIPPPLMTSTPGSFARKTIVERKPQILREVGRAIPYPPEIQTGLAEFALEIRQEPVRALTEDAPDRALWDAAWAAHRGKLWLEIPWFFAETYFYRRLMEVVRFYQPGPWKDVDPFAPQKAAELESALPAFLPVLEQPLPDDRAALTVMLRDALWGNRADLSNRTISATAAEGLRDQQDDRLLIDDTARIWRHLSADGPQRVDLVADNSGLELLLDLRLVDALIERQTAAQAIIHLKPMPFFVSDAMVRDVQHTLDRLSASSSSGQALGVRLRQALAEGRIALRDDPFWSTCHSYHQLPARLSRDLGSSHLVLFKGDVNYRRLLDDRCWPHTARLAEILPGFPTSLLTLRTLKGELIVDLQPGQAERLAAEDPTWMINGQRGLIQFVERAQ